MNKKRLFCVWAITLAMLVGSIGSSDAGTIAPPGERLSQGDEAMVSSGKPIGSPFLIVDEVAGVHAAFPAAAYNSQRQEYLVVWGNIRTGCSDIAAQRISTSGTLLGSRIWVAHGCPEDRDNPDVAYNSQDDEYLVVWNEDETDVRGQLLSGDGALSGAAFDIALSVNDGSTSYTGSDPVVAYNATENLYLMVYDSHLTTGHGILAQALSNNGSAYGTSFEIEALSTSSALQPDVAYNSLRNEFLVVWVQSNPSYWDIRGRFVKVTGGWYGASGSAFWFDCDAGTDD
ncbi:MAG: hypothetical protein JW726_18680, partial [Anaerolineales bacterium]|nr:hypothetical protein [Anaerolineales bacterium]